MATVYISPTGDDSRTYADAQVITTPWQTITKCIASATTGDTIICLNGTYPWISQTFTKVFLIQAQTNGSVIWDAAGVNIKWDVGAYASTFTGLTFQNNGAPTAADDMIFYLRSINSFTNCIFQDIVVNNSDGNAAGGGLVSGYTSAYTATFTNCAFINILNDKTYETIRGGIFQTRVSSSITLTNCLIYLNPSSSATAFYCIFRGYAAGTGVYTITLKNTIIHNASSESLVFDFITGGTNTKTVTYTDTYGTGLSAQAGTGNIAADPLFVDAANSNFNLRPTSPCIDTGSL